MKSSVISTKASKMCLYKEVVRAVFDGAVFAWWGGGASFTPLCHLDHGRRESGIDWRCRGADLVKNGRCGDYFDKLICGEIQYEV